MKLRQTLLMVFMVIILSLTASAAVTVTMANPQPGDTIYNLYQMAGTSTTTTGSIVSTDVLFDGSSCIMTGFCTLSSAVWQGTLYASSLGVGSHTLQVTSMDSMGNSGSSPIVTFTIAHTSNNCSHTLVSGNIYCEQGAQGAWTFQNTGQITFPSFVKGRAFIQFVTTGPQLTQGGLHANITSGATSFDVDTISCGLVQCNWPPVPFYAYLSDFNVGNTGTEKIRVTAVSGTAPGTQHFVVDQRGLPGTCFAAGNYPNATPNMPFIGGTAPISCGSAASHLINTFVNLWPISILPKYIISDTLGLKWTQMYTSVSGPLGDFSNTPGAIFTAEVPTTASPDTISFNVPTQAGAPLPGIKNQFILGVAYSGIGVQEPGFSNSAGFGGPDGLGDMISGPYTTVVGDLNLGFCGGAPTIPAAGWNLRYQDTIRPLLMVVDQIAASTTAQVQCAMNSEGYGANGFAFKPLTATATPVLRTTTTAPCWVVNNPQIGTPWDTSGNHVNQLVGTSSTGTGGLTYKWSIIAGPNTPTITNSTSATTTVTGVIAGEYTARLCLTDNNGQNCADLTIGAIGIDANGVVIQTDPNTTQIYGPMIALGYNPWCYEDERNIEAAILQDEQNPYPAQAAAWNTRASGSIDYNMFGRGFGTTGSPAGATLNGGINATVKTIQIHTSQNLTCLSTLPCWAVIGGYGGEIIRISESIGMGATCGMGASPVVTGDAQLCIAYDGRGLSPTPPVATAVTGQAAMWSTGTVVADMAVKGTGTLFSTDLVRPVCPAGAPGPPGPVIYTTGTVSVTHSSATITGSGTNWTLDPTANAGTIKYNQNGTGTIGSMIVVSGTTHNTGTPFTFWRLITAVNSTTSLTVDHAFPSDADDASGLSYKITGTQYLATDFTDAAAPIYGMGLAGTYRFLQDAQGCESNTLAFAIAIFDISGSFGSGLQAQTGQAFSYKNDIGACSGFGPNFYATGFALRAAHYRSGINAWLLQANAIDNLWVRDPQVASGFLGCSAPLFSGGGHMGGLANTVLNTEATSQWSDLRPWASVGVGFYNTWHGACNNTNPYDTRDQAYLLNFFTQAALYDPDSTNKANWLTALGSAGSGAGALGRQTNHCAHADNSYAVGLIQPALFPGQAPNRIVTVATGSPIVMGTGMTANMCGGTDTGTITVMHGSTMATKVSGTLGTNATLPPMDNQNYNIVIWDNMSSPQYVGVLQFTFSGSTVTLAAPWNGANGTFTYLVQNNMQGPGPGAANNFGGMTAFGLTGLDSDNLLQSEAWACTFNSSTQITLNRPWDVGVTAAAHPSGTAYMYDSANFGVGPGGYYEQPFMHGINTKVMSWLSNYASDTTVANGFKALIPGAAQWFHDVGFNPNTLGAYYGRVTLECEPFLVANPSPTFISIHGAGPLTSCGYSGLTGDPPDTNGDSEQPERVNAQESFADVNEYAISQCLLGPSQCTAAIAFGDQVYGGIWGKCSWTTGVYCDSRYVNITGELGDGSIGNFKWTGFFFGMGGAHIWPALRLSLSPPVTGNPSIQYHGGVGLRGGVH